MDNEFKWIESIERGTASLIGIIDANRWMEAEIVKRKRTQRIALPQQMATSSSAKER